MCDLIPCGDRVENPHQPHAHDDDKTAPNAGWCRSQETRQERGAATAIGGICGGEVDHCWATDGQHDSQNQPTLFNDDTSWKLCELRVFDDFQQCSITVRWHSQGGSAGSNPVGATNITAGQRRYGAGCEHRWGCHFCPWATAVQRQLRLVSQSCRSVRSASW
jgi:hypothetical protein